jgi:hypothetical protein
LFIFFIRRIANEQKTRGQKAMELLDTSFVARTSKRASQVLKLYKYPQYPNTHFFEAPDESEAAFFAAAASCFFRMISASLEWEKTEQCAGGGSE